MSRRDRFHLPAPGGRTGDCAVGSGTPGWGGEVSGAGVRGGSGEDAEAMAEWHAWWLPQWVAISEGFCPSHKTPLEPVRCAPGWAGGHCPQCRAYWGDELEKKNVRWTLDHQPYGDWRPVYPEWVLP